MKKQKPAHINEIKPIYDERCQAIKGPAYEYAGGFPFAEYKTLRNLYKQHPNMRVFREDQCHQQIVPLPTTDPINSAYLFANTPWKCKQLEGSWDANALSRTDHRSRGVCFVGKGDRRCAKADCEAYIKHAKRGNVMPPQPILTSCKSKCAQLSGCGMYKTGECHSLQTLENHAQRVKNEAARKLQRQAKARMLRKSVAQRIDHKKKDAAIRTIQKQARVVLLKRRLEQKRTRNLLNMSMKRQAVGTIETAVSKHLRRADRLPNDWPVDLRSPDVKDYMLRYYTKTKEQWPVKSSKLEGSDNSNRCKATSPSAEHLFSVPQAMMHAIARGIQRGKNRGMLAWHSTGSGKTCTAAAIMDAFWNTNKHIIFCTSIEAKSANPPETFTRCMNRYLGRKVQPSDMLKRVKFVSFAQLAHYLQLYRPSGPKHEAAKRSNLLNDAVLVIDEVQNLLKPLPSQVKEHNALYKFLKNNESKTKNLKMFILTATPGESSKDIVDLLNIVRDRRHTEIKIPNVENKASVDDFKRKVQGIIQYFNTNNDLTRFPKVITNEVYKCSMSADQLTEYSRALKEDLGKKIMPNYPHPKYYSLSRKYAGMLYHRKCMSLADYSCKLAKLVSMLEIYDKEKHWIYSAFYEQPGKGGYGQGVIGTKKVLEDDLGYEQLTPSMARKMLNGQLSKTKKKRFCVLTTTLLTQPIQQSMRDILTVYNSIENVKGEICHVMLASQKFNEGVDLKAVRHVHLLEPLLTDAMLRQAIGRARRHCSHAQLPNTKDWTVQLHQYDSTVLKPSNANLINFNKRLTNYTEQLNRLQNKLTSIKGLKGMKEQRHKLAAQKGDIQRAIRDTKREQRDTLANPTADMSIDETVRNLSKQYSENPQQELMLTIMKNASVDCKILKRFHGDASISCT